MPANRTQIEITTQFTRRGELAKDIATVTPGFPKIRIWGASSNSIKVNNEKMTPVSSGAINDGLYRYVFTANKGFNQNEFYVVSFDGGDSLPNHERYNYGQIVPDWEERIYEELTSTKPGSIGDMVNDIFATTIYLRKFETNRTWIDVNNAELIVYDDDGQTILWRFKLLDSRGEPNIDEIAERLPIKGGAMPFNVLPTP